MTTKKKLVLKYNPIKAILSALWSSSATKFLCFLFFCRFVWLGNSGFLLNITLLISMSVYKTVVDFAFQSRPRSSFDRKEGIGVRFCLLDKVALLVAQNTWEYGLHHNSLSGTRSIFCVCNLLGMLLFPLKRTPISYAFHGGSELVSKESYWSLKALWKSFNNI